MYEYTSFLPLVLMASLAASESVMRKKSASLLTAFFDTSGGSSKSPERIYNFNNTRNTSGSRSIKYACIETQLKEAKEAKAEKGDGGRLSYAFLVLVRAERGIEKTTKEFRAVFESGLGGLKDGPTDIEAHPARGGQARRTGLDYACCFLHYLSKLLNLNRRFNSRHFSLNKV